MKIIASVLFALMLAVSTMGCGSNACESACDKMKECNVEGTSSIDCTGECPSEYEPMMDCIAGLSCDDMKDAAKMLACYSTK